MITIQCARKKQKTIIESVLDNFIEKNNECKLKKKPSKEKKQVDVLTKFFQHKKKMKSNKIKTKKIKRTIDKKAVSQQDLLLKSLKKTKKKKKKICFINNKYYGLVNTNSLFRSVNRKA